MKGSDLPLFSITASDTVAVVAPRIGASLQRFAVADRDVLRRGRPDLWTPLEMSSFPLVPWCNRILDGGFDWNGRRLELGGTPTVREPHALHGHGWLWKWEVSEVTDDRLSLEYLHPAGWWPWRYRSRLTTTVEPGRLVQELSIENLSADAMPFSLGFHPYFERPARLTANVDGIWRGEQGVIPTRWEAHEAFRAADLDRTDLDNSFTGWDGKAYLEMPAGRVELSSDQPILHVYSPPGRGFFCAEPVGAAPGALNFESRGGDVLAPGSTATATMRISVLS